MYLALERYSRPTSVAQCLRLLAEPGQKVALLSGGTDVNVSGHEELTHVVDLQALPLADVQVRDGTLRLGARATLTTIRRHEALRHERLAALREGAAALAIVALQNRSTLGGRIVADRSDQDLPPALAVLGAQLVLVRLGGGGVEQTVIQYPIGAAARVALAGALVTEVLIPLGAGRSALRRFGRTAVDVPLATCAAAGGLGGVRLAANLQGPSAADLRRMCATEALVASWGEGLPPQWREQAREALLGEIVAYGDDWASGEYRRDLTATLMVRALAAVLGEEEIA